MAYGDQTLTIVEIDQPLCTNTYGDGLGSPRGSPGGCTAMLGVTGTRKCFNTRATCQDEANYLPGTLTLRFAKPQRGLQQYGYVLPLLDGEVETTPGSVNLAAMDRSASALGQREVITMRFKNVRHSDLHVDKYRLERASGVAEVSELGSPSSQVGYDPYTRGTFWGKWLARNPYYSAYALRVYRGTMGQALEDMEVRHYLIDRIDGPNRGGVTLVAKDKFSRIEAKKAVAPTASRGELAADITAVSASFAVSPSGIGDTDYPYPPGSPSEMYVAIGEEIIKCTRSADTFTVLQRGALGTTAAAHNDEDLVQWVLPYVVQSPHDIIYDLLTEYGGIDAADIDQAEWDQQASEVTVLYTAYIAKPTPVNELVGEICEQAGVTVWPDVRTGEIRLRALRARSSVATLTDNAWILRGSLRTRRLEERRVSQVWVYYGKKNPLGDHKDPRNYYSRLIELDSTAEDEDQFDAPKVHEVFSRWIPQFGRTSASETGNRILTIFRDPPLAADLEVDRGREGAFDVTDYLTLDTASIEDETGANDQTQVAVLSCKRSDGRMAVGAMEISFDPLEGDESSDDERVIFIENDTSDVNLRTLHDTLYAPPTEGSPGLRVRFVVETGVRVYATSTAAGAIRTGIWPSTTTVTLQNRGTGLGRGGDGATWNGATDMVAGQDGGPAVSIDSAFSFIVDNSAGILAGGGGGGGGNLDSYSFEGATFYQANPGGGGAGGGRGGSYGDSDGAVAPYTEELQGGLGGALDAVGADGITGPSYQEGDDTIASAGGGGRVFPGTGGDGADGAGTSVSSAGKGGGAGGGGGGSIGELGNGGADAGDGGAAGVAGGGAGSVQMGGGGGGWGAAGGSSGCNRAAGAAGKAIALNGFTALVGSPSGTLYGAIG